MFHSHYGSSFAVLVIIYFTNVPSQRSTPGGYDVNVSSLVHREPGTGLIPWLM